MPNIQKTSGHRVKNVRPGLILRRRWEYFWQEEEDDSTFLLPKSDHSNCLNRLPLTLASHALRLQQEVKVWKDVEPFLHLTFKKLSEDRP
jgi:hypothetical protein